MRVLLICLMAVFYMSSSAQEDISVKLKMDTGGSFLGIVYDYGMPIASTKNFIYPAFLCKNFSIFRFRLDLTENEKKYFNEGLRSKAYWKDNDTLLFNDKCALDTALLINFINVFSGIDTLGRLVVIPDLNHNYSFLDDSIYIYSRIPLSKDSMTAFRNKLPVHKITASLCINGKIVDEPFYFRLIPRSYYQAFSKLPDSTVDTVRMLLSSDTYFHKVFSLGNVQYVLLLQNGSSPKLRITSPQDVLISISPFFNNDSLAYNSSYRFNTIGDTIALSGNNYTVQLGSIIGDSIILKYSGKVIDSFGYTPGKVPYSISSKDVNGKRIIINRKRDNYLLLDFWGSWCQPCIAAFPKLKKLINDPAYRKLSIVGIAYDDDHVKVKKVLDTNHISWSNIFDDSNGPNSISKKFRIWSYPTYILIDPNGKIIFRDTGTLALINYLNNIKFN